MRGASIEAMLGLWASSLPGVKRRIEPLFSQKRVAVSAGSFVDAPLGMERRKTGWMRAEAAGDAGRGDSKPFWVVIAVRDAPRDVGREPGLETWADDQAVVVIDETGFLKQAKKLRGAPAKPRGSASTQTTGSTPGTTSRPSQDRQADRCAWDEAKRHRLSAGEGTKGPRLHDWAYCELADFDQAAYDNSATGLGTRGLLIRRAIADGELAFFSTWCPAATGIATRVKVEGQRWTIEDGFETAKNELGLDHNETRSQAAAGTATSRSSCWPFAMMAIVRHHANTMPPPKTRRRFKLTHYAANRRETRPWQLSRPARSCRGR